LCRWHVCRRGDRVGFGRSPIRCGGFDGGSRQNDFGRTEKLGNAERAGDTGAAVEVEALDQNGVAGKAAIGDRRDFVGIPLRGGVAACVSERTSAGFCVRFRARRFDADGVAEFGDWKKRADLCRE
jgi:hypothetical protein